MSRRAERQAKEAQLETPTMVLPVMKTKTCYECKKPFDWYGECWVYQRRKKNGKREYACSYKCWRAEDHRKETKLRGEGFVTYGDKQKALYVNNR